ncbi:hypothetical protein G7B21_29280, partial [Klebsiella pneumoniae]|nr:hypothetical protein [Klebsiella pneumoniae]
FGPLVSFPHRDNVLRYIESGKREARAAVRRRGDLFADDTNFGPLVSFPHRDNVLRYIESGKREARAAVRRRG